MMKNGKIEFLRFFFCLVVLLFHCAKYFWGSVSFTSGIRLSLFSHGAMAVEFFFMLSGLLMAKSVCKRAETPISGEALAREYGSFMRKKYMSVFPVHCIGFVIVFVCSVLQHRYGFSQILRYFADSVPNLFLIEMSGLRLRDPNHIEWYISCMLLVMAIFYPFCRKAYHMFTRCFAPVFALLTIGFLIHTTGSLTGVTVWTGVCYKSFLRAAADIALGACCFEFSRFLSRQDFTKRQRVLLTAAEWLCYAAVITFTLLTFPIVYEGLMPFILFFAIGLSFSGKTGVPAAWNRKWIFFLGSFSLPVYIVQLGAIYLVQAYGTALSAGARVWTAAGLTIVLALAVHLLDGARNRLCKR